MTKKSYEMDMCNGPLWGKILLFSIPLMLSGILQLLFNAADIIVVGRYAGSEALAAVGSTSSLINLLTNVFIGLSVGSNVLIARSFGAKQEEEVSETVHTSILLSLISGTILCLMGILLAKPLLTLMGTPNDVLSQAALYMKIYFAGMPVIMLYNFGSSILRAIGDTKRPLYFLAIAGIVNVILNLCFVIIFKMSVEGVALATVISQCISAFLIIRCLMHQENSCRLQFSKLHLHRDKVFKIIQIGLPAGMQGAIFSISNVLIQSSVNSFGSIAMAGNTASANIEGFIYTSMNAFHQTALSFTGQNLGAKKYKRIGKVLIICLILVSITGLSMGLTTVYFGQTLLGIYSSDPQVIQYGLARMQIICLTYFTCGLMDVIVGSLRGLGYSIMPMIVSLLGACGLRILWIFTIFVWHRSLFTLYISYPISWVITFSAHILCYFIVRHKVIPHEATSQIAS
ncbi:MAG: MATE family efflux transporter [Candidatus Cellulosilyticum pullistercoris]|uniref:Probable multidrug resistance protein NorM n=1 Tax=Candidatus Cellulosilyticum pullistercoris TaxID=2838521 RepID=A0A9E2KB71_9FIRM|nr:MATE family efflux transporter [Candidatus Cellulosilyticum pullistercoris]